MYLCTLEHVSRTVIFPGQTREDEVDFQNEPNNPLLVTFYRILKRDAAVLAGENKGTTGVFLYPDNPGYSI